MALAYTAPTWVNGSGTGISASQLQALSDCMEGLVQGSDKAITNIAISGQTITLTFADGSQETGTAGGLKGISSIAKTGTSGLVDTYTITYTDGSTATFTVTNGATGPAGPAGPQGPQGIQGPAGDDGVSPEVTITTITGGHRVNITDADHPSGQNFDVMDGATQDISGKADKVSNATNGDFAGLDANGNLTDSGKKASDFLPSDTPIPDEVTANPQGTATGTLTKLGIGSDIYEIQGGGGSTVSIADSGTASASATSQQQLTINGVSTDISGSKYMEQTINAQANTDTTFTFTNAAITYASVLDIFAGCKTADYDIPTLKSKTLSVSGATGSLTLVYNVPTAYALTVRVYIRG